MNKYLSLVIPTNGIIEWCIPVIESIYSQKVDNSLFEVIVSDNGNSNEFEAKMMEYCHKYDNFIYKRTNAQLFMNQIEAFKMAKGEFIKFVNHRTKLEKGALMKLIEYVKNNKEIKPITYFLNDACKIIKKKNYYSDFDSYAYELKNYSSWSGGISCWKSDLIEIINSSDTYSLFPHMIFCYYYKPDRKYFINNEKLFNEITVDDTMKGKYDVFRAFCVEYVEYILKLYNDKMIDSETKNIIIKSNEKFIAYLYYLYIIRKKKCSYDLSTYRESISIYYSYSKIRKLAVLQCVKKLFYKIKR